MLPALGFESPCPHQISTMVLIRNHRAFYFANFAIICYNQFTKLEFDEKGECMKKFVSLILLHLIMSIFFVGCGKQKIEQVSQTTTIGNPWSDWNTIEEAESAIGFSFGFPEVVADSYDAVSIRTLNDELIEVVYHDDDFEVCVRKRKGEGQDISGDYNEYETCTEEYNKNSPQTQDLQAVSWVNITACFPRRTS